jgi:hypothetical protein
MPGNYSFFFRFSIFAAMCHGVTALLMKQMTSNETAVKCLNDCLTARNCTKIQKTGQIKVFYTKDTDLSI